MVATPRFARGGQRQRTTHVEVRTRCTFIGPKRRWGLTCVWDEFASGADFNTRSLLPLPSASEASGTDHLYGPRSVIPGVGNFATYDRVFLHFRKTCNFSWWNSWMRRFALKSRYIIDRSFFLYATFDFLYSRTLIVYSLYCCMANGIE